mmetsp:Transcript_37134/g.80381  ORF Transcript_37134/g.80381 Transcript_37134/m.80381 type:complete len:211 (+) Transcript_37134:343-975(+)
MVLWHVGRLQSTGLCGTLLWSFLGGRSRLIRPTLATCDSHTHTLTYSQSPSIVDTPVSECSTVNCDTCDFKGAALCTGSSLFLVCFFFFFRFFPAGLSSPVQPTGSLSSLSAASNSRSFRSSLRRNSRSASSSAVLSAAAASLACCSALSWSATFALCRAMAEASAPCSNSTSPAYTVPPTCSCLVAASCSGVCPFESFELGLALCSRSS